jgi:hypothetical protein
MKPIPKKLYKYCHPKDVVILESGKIAYTPPVRFNDPFDFDPAVDLDTDDKTLEESWLLSKKEFPDVQAPPLHDWIIDQRARASENTDAIRRDLRIQYNENFGVFCLSANPSDCLDGGPLMWSHYADSHRGFAIEFDAENEFFRGRMVDVYYNDVRPLIKSHEDSREVWRTKSNCWKYENEWRSISALSACEPPILSDGGDCIYLHQFPKKSVLKVFCGCRMNPELFKYLQTSLPKWGYQCSLEKMAMHPKEYRLLLETTSFS